MAKSFKCPECGANMVLRTTTKFTYKNGVPRKFYGCERWPKCQATHGSHPDGTPLGVPADKQTKQDRIRAHEVFDNYATQKGLSKKQQYLLLKDLMQLTQREAHIASFNTLQCNTVIERIEALKRNEWPNGAATKSKIIAALIGRTTMEHLRKAFVDLLDGCKEPHEIHEKTGLPMERCEEIYDIYLLAQLGLDALEQ